jgi:GNAT superfamily N-acetyltransferase
VLVIAPATKDDLPALIDLFEEIDRFYGDVTEGTALERMDQVNAVLFGEPPKAMALLAKDGDQLVGMASYSFLWPAAGITTSLYLKELYVRQDQRRTGVGRQLMDQVIDVARGQGCTRVEWTTDRENAEAQGFYAELGHGINAGKVFYRIEL